MFCLCPFSLSQIFAVLEENKERLSVETYSVSETTLEQVFLAFAKESDTKKEDKVRLRSPLSFQLLLYFGFSCVVLFHTSLFCIVT